MRLAVVWLTVLGLGIITVLLPKILLRRDWRQTDFATWKANKPRYNRFHRILMTCMLLAILWPVTYILCMAVIIGVGWWWLAQATILQFCIVLVTVAIGSLAGSYAFAKKRGYLREFERRWPK